MGNNVQEISKRTGQACTGVGKWDKSIAYCRVQGGWVGQECGGSERYVLSK